MLGFRAGEKGKCPSTEESYTYPGLGFRVSGLVLRV